MRARLILAAAAAAALAAPSPAPAARPLVTGFYDSAFGEAPQTWIPKAQAIGAGAVRVHFEWSDIAPAERPAGFDARDPASPGYRWDALDANLRLLTDAGLSVILSFDETPRWAEGPGRPSAAPPGSWKPQPAAVGDFGSALARRYSGRFSDATGSRLPRVRAFQLWNEPNLAAYLMPQWSGRRAVSPHHFRRMLNAFRTAVRAQAPAALVATGGTSPFGDPERGGQRMQPMRFIREMLCLRQDLRRRSCKDSVRFDVIAHHPYSVGRPRRRALNRDDVSIPDLGKIRRAVRAARRLNTLRARPRLWVTEVSYDSNPPDPDGVPAATHARWVEETLYLLWKQGASTVIWLTIRDEAPEPSYDTTIQAGPYRRDGRAKPAARAFRFPFVAERLDRSRVRVWGRSPLAGRLVVERRSRSRWVRVTSLRPGARRTFTRILRLRSRTTLRARVGGDTSLSWTQR